MLERKMRAPLWIASLSVLALGACAMDDEHPANPAPLTPTERYSIEVRPSPDELQLAPHTAGLSPAQLQALTDLVARWNGGSRGPLTVKAPEHGPDPSGVYRTATDARDFLLAQGIQPQDVRIVGYDAQGDAQAPVRVGFVGYVAQGPQCGQDWGNLADVRSNREYDQFGCSMTANVAAELASPEDLLHPRAMTPPDASRRETVITKYRQGDTTSTTRDAQANGAVSSTLGQ
jgi:pilus assembly protein CpaD